mmetsp:Transcript_31232/g.101851  ORF Transcript_31232/g.101851 Transcript_31232/m.101851 type:complete len:304 (-) Transcript_31232:37-948(-)
MLVGSIAKLLRVVNSVPRLERFVGDVCEVVFGAGYMQHAGSAAALDKNPQSVPAILKGWVDSLRSLEELREFRAIVTHELQRRCEGPPREGALPAELAAQIRDLIEMERAHLLTKANFQNAEAALKAEPEALVNKICAHFQHLFEVRALDGVLPKMNQLYMQGTEAKNFMRVLRQLLGLEEGAGVQHVLSRVRQILDTEAEQLDLKSEYMLGRPSVPPEGGVDGPHAMHIRIVKHLLDLFGVDDATRVVPHAERLLAKTQKLDATLPRYQAVLNELYDVLRIVSIDEIVPSVKALIGATASAR